MKRIAIVTGASSGMGREFVRQLAQWERFEEVCLGDGPVDAVFNAIDKIVKPVEHSFEIFSINSVSQGKDTLGGVTVKLQAGGRTFTGHGLSTDVIEASVLAYIDATNKMQHAAQAQKQEA